ncbi:hypothetical protein EDB82DRAFT_260046 [Fusarium venenatum]|uniref:uncharacterized protein n=1 Tax=Fusarium venenatum TaxID=56646 RepID=UPI001DBD2BA5|nr:hypothetical protein EDB82DRAFT_260046 [Fusarium venenatum]
MYWLASLSCCPVSDVARAASPVRYDSLSQHLSVGTVRGATTGIRYGAMRCGAVHRWQHRERGFEAKVSFYLTAFLSYPITALSVATKLSQKACNPPAHQRHKYSCPTAASLV